MTLKRLVTTTAIAAALAISGAGAFAQPAATPSPSSPGGTAVPHAAAPAVTSTQTARHMSADQIRASKLIGSGVYDPNDQKIGSIEELVLNPDGKVADVVVGVGGFLGAGEKHVAVAMNDLKHGKDNRLVLNTTKDALKQMASYDLKAADSAHSGSSTPR
jgi:sporulation protein YlmC with PRC-barrel domain